MSQKNKKTTWADVIKEIESHDRNCQKRHEDTMRRFDRLNKGVKTLGFSGSSWKFKFLMVLYFVVLFSFLVFMLSIPYVFDFEKAEFRPEPRDRCGELYPTDKEWFDRKNCRDALCKGEISYPKHICVSMNRYINMADGYRGPK